MAEDPSLNFGSNKGALVCVLWRESDNTCNANGGTRELNEKKSVLYRRVRCDSYHLQPAKRSIQRIPSGELGEQLRCECKEGIYYV